MSEIGNLEQRIMEVWQVVDDLEDLQSYLMDSPDFKDLDAKHLDTITNLVFSYSTVYNRKFQRCFEAFEALCKEHGRLRRADGIRKNKVWPTEERIDVIGQNGNTGDHYEEEA